MALLADGTGGSGVYEYQFSDNVTGTMAVTQAYSGNSTRVWNTTGWPLGTYSHKVDIRNLGSTAASQAIHHDRLHACTASGDLGGIHTRTFSRKPAGSRCPSDRDGCRQRWVGAV